MNRYEASLGVQTALELVLPFSFGFIIALLVLRGLTPPLEMLHWFFGSSIGALASLLGLIGLVITFRIQHIREQIRDVQTAVLTYSKDGLCWIFAGFDLDEITRRKDWLFSQAYKAHEEELKSDTTPEDIEYDQANLDAYRNERIRFGEMLKTYIDLENERKGMYRMIVPPIVLIVGTTIVSIFGLILGDIISSEGTYGPAFFVGAVALLIWLIVRVGIFLITMIYKERKIRVYVTVDVADKKKQ
jgi:hypothetical protein